jgi:hypothetical protein
MSIGVQPSQSTLNNLAGQYVLSLRNDFENAARFNDYLNNLGNPGLVALGFSSDDANLLLAIFGNIAAIATVYTGGEYTGPNLPFDFQSQTIPLWGGN